MLRPDLRFYSLMVAVFLGLVSAQDNIDTCPDNCVNFCLTFNSAVIPSPLLPLIGIDTNTVLAKCQSNCDAIFCPCLADGILECGRIRSGCVNNGPIDTYCQFQFSNCMALRFSQCFAQVGANLINSLIPPLPTPFPVIYNGQT